MEEPRLKTGLVVQAALRISSLQAIPMVVARRGDADAGTIIIKLNRLDLGCTILIQARAANGMRGWLKATGELPVPEATADAYIARQVQRDPDLWVVEIQDRAGRQVFDGPVLGA